MLVPPLILPQCTQVPSTLCKVGKRTSQLLVATSATGRSNSHLFFLQDRNSSLHFLVDTGAEVSVIPPSGPRHTLPPTGYSLQAVKQSSIATCGTRSLTLDLGL